MAPLRFQLASNPIPTPTLTSDSTGASSDRMEVEARIVCGCHSRWRSPRGKVLGAIRSAGPWGLADRTSIH